MRDNDLVTGIHPARLFLRAVGVVASRPLLFLSLSAAVTLLCLPLATAAVIRGVSVHLRGGGSILLGAITGLVVGAGALCVVPGLVLMTLFYVAMPALVLEGRSPVEALRRGVTLSEGFRWQIFALIALLWCVKFGLQSLSVYALTARSLDAAFVEAANDLPGAAAQAASSLAPGRPRPPAAAPASRRVEPLRSFIPPHR